MSSATSFSVAASWSLFSSQPSGSEWWNKKFLCPGRAPSEPGAGKGSCVPDLYSVSVLPCILAFSDASYFSRLHFSWQRILSFLSEWRTLPHSSVWCLPAHFSCHPQREQWVNSLASNQLFTGGYIACFSTFEKYGGNEVRCFSLYPIGKLSDKQNFCPFQ